MKVQYFTPGRSQNEISFYRKISFLLLLVMMASAGTLVSQSYNGYTLYFPQGGTKAFLADLSGGTYHSWTFPGNKSTTYATYLLEGGDLLRTVNHQGNYFTGGPILGEVMRVDWDGNVLWDYVYSTQQYCSHHDIHPMPNGNVLLIAYERKTAAEAVQAGCAQSLEMWPDKIVEIEPSGTSGGTVVWEWHAWDHLVQDHDATKDNWGVVKDHPELLNINYHTSKDWMHMNGIDYNQELDQITFSSHSLNEVYVIDHSTSTAEAASHSGGNSGHGGDILYRWGNPAAYQATGTTWFNVVHDAHWVPDDDPRFPGALCGYNNKGGPGVKTCVDIFNPPYDGFNYTWVPGTEYEPAVYDWRHVYSGSMSQDNGNSQQLPNGNTLICIGMSGFIYEIDSNENQVWSKNAGTVIAQSFRYPLCYITGEYAAEASGNPGQICKGTSVQLDVTATGGEVYIYSWSSNPPGFSSSLKNPVVTPDATTTYYITIKNGPCVASDSVTITVWPDPPAPEIIQNGDTLYSSASAGNQWYFNGTLMPGETGMFIVPLQNGIYQVRITDIHGCVSPLSEEFSVTWVGFDEHGMETGALVYPNPAGKVIFLNHERIGEKEFDFALYNSTGQCIIVVHNPGSVDISRLPGGIWFYRIKTGTGVEKKGKLVIIKSS